MTIITEIAKETVLKIYNTLNSQEITSKDKFRGIVDLFSDFLNNLLEDEKLHFPTLYAKTFFINNKYNIPNDLSSKIREIYFKNKRLTENKYSRFFDSYNQFAFKSIVQFITKIVQIDFDDDFNEFLNSIKDIHIYHHNIQDKDIITLFNAVVISKTKSDRKEYLYEILCRNDDIGDFKLYCYGIWKEQPKLMVEGMKINIINANYINIDDYFYIGCYDSSYLVLEPDFLVDVTEISQSSGENYYLPNFIRRFTEKRICSESLLFGSLANHLFDELIINPEIDFNTSIKNAIKSKPLSYIYLRENGLNEKYFVTKLQKTFDSLRTIVNKFEEGDYSTEPSFISPDFGIQGRLDLLIENEDIDYALVVELKSGKAPPANQQLIINKKVCMTGIKEEHLYQIAGYNLLLNYINENVKLNTMLLYIQDAANPLRAAVCEKLLLNSFLIYRNWIISLDFNVRAGKFKIFDNMSKINHYHLPFYYQNDINNFIGLYCREDKIIQEWFKEFTQFILNEIYLAKVGDIDCFQNGHSSLWKDNIEKKLENRLILFDMEFKRELSDFESMHLFFGFKDGFIKSVLRNGDIVLLYPNNDDEKNASKNVILKGYIIKIDNQGVLISLRNKTINRRKLILCESWNIEPDFTDTNNRVLLSSIFEIFNVDKEKAKILLGISSQKVNNEQIEITNNLNEVQREIFNKAINADSYFLIQGPPGTGKTSYMLTSLVSYYFSHSSSNILICAYTNRAVEEIYKALLKVINSDDMLRIGSKTGNESDKILVSIISENMKIKELASKIQTTRIFLSTISSLHTNGEIFALKKFDVAIVDEASQILEPQIIGILAKVSKFILIGDEKQLPAVVLQDSRNTQVNSDLLKDIELHDKACSYFERMINICNKNNWNSSFGMLEYQSRMHEQIQEFPNRFFYDGRLKVNYERQKESIKLFNKYSNNKLEQFLSGFRVSFIDCPIETENKISNNETVLIKEIIEIIENNVELFDVNLLGIISPFRLQCNNIQSCLDERIRDLITIDTVERFQGSERRNIIISMAVNSVNLLDRATSYSESIGMDRKLNVAVTRAKEHLIMLGNSEILSNNNTYKEFIEFCRENGSYIRIDQLSDSFLDH